MVEELLFNFRRLSLKARDTRSLLNIILLRKFLKFTEND